MRRLWIRRHKAGSGKVKVFIEDPENGDVIISDVFCRKVAELENDQQKHISIPLEAATIFVLAGKDEALAVSREIPEGEDDIFLSGRKTKNGFRFDDEEEDSAQTSEKRAVRWGAVLAVVLLLLGIAGSVVMGLSVMDKLLDAKAAAPADKTFTCQELTITLNEQFVQTGAAGYTACYSSGDAAVFVLREGFDAKEGFGDLTVTEYGEMVLQKNGLSETAELGEYGGLTAFHHVSAVGETQFYYYVVLLKGEDAFWMVQITSLYEGAEKNMPQYQHWAQSIVLVQ